MRVTQVQGPPSAARGGRFALTLALAAVLALLAAVLHASPTAAHATLLDSTPSDGETLDEAIPTAELHFNEPVEIVQGAIVLFAPDGSSTTPDARTADGTVTVDLPEMLGEGTHTLTYRVTSADGHPVGGSLTFHVGHPSDVDGSAGHAAASGTSTATEGAVVSGTALQYLGLLGFTGLVLVRSAVIRSPDQPSRRERGLLIATLVIAAVATWLLVPLLALRVAGAGLAVVTDSSRWVSAVSSDSLLAAVVVTLAGTTAYAALRTGTTRSTRAVAVAGALVAVATPVLVGHSRSVHPAWLIVPADVVHLVVGSFWFGGVLGLIAHLRELRGPQDSPIDASGSAVKVVGRFSRMAGTSVLLLALSGGAMALLVLDSPGDLVGTRYGLTLLAKLAVIAVVVAIAGLNRFRILPGLHARPTAVERWRGLRRTLTAEASLIVIVLALTGVLTNSPPSDSDAVDPASNDQSSVIPLEIQSQGLTVTGEIAPAASGPNILTFTLTYEGEPVDTDEIEVSARLPELDLGPITAETTALDDGTGYRSEITLPTAGEWQLEVAARVSTYDRPIAVTSIDVP